MLSTHYSVIWSVSYLLNVFISVTGVQAGQVSSVICLVLVEYVH